MTLASAASNWAALLTKKLSVGRFYGKYIRDIPYFRGLRSDIHVQLAKSVKTLTAAKETTIMEEGQLGTEMFILIEGEVVVEKAGIELGYFNSPGSFFGESPIIVSSGDLGGTLAKSQR